MQARGYRGNKVKFMNELLSAARRYKEMGISTIAADSNKRSVVQWKKYQAAVASEEDLSVMFTNQKTSGLAIVCGAVSGGLEVIDVDCKYDLTGSLFEDFMQLIVDDLPELAGRLVIASTKGGGYHILYRCLIIEGNLKLARRETTEAERAGDAHDKVRVLIETRGEGGYIIAAPSTGYSFKQGELTDIPVITPDQRAAIFEIARSFNQLHEQVSHQYAVVDQKAYNKSPFQDYNERGDIVGLLVSHGWKQVRDDGKKVYFQRPGNTSARTSGDYNRELGVFAVFTTSSEFEPQKGYRPAAVFCMLECGNDWKAAARKLLDQGFGEPFKKVSREIKKFIRRHKEDGTEGEPLQAKVADKFKLTLEEAQKSIESVAHDDAAAEGEFWTYDPTNEKLGISYVKFARFLETNGFGLYFYDESSTIYKMVHNDHNRLEEATIERIKKFIKAYVIQYELIGVSFTKEQLLEVLYKNSNLFSDNTWQWMQGVNIDFLRDTKDVAYFPFKNGVIEITAGNIRLRKYGEVDKVIWKSDIIKFNVDIDYSKMSLEEDPGCEFIDFLTKALGGDQARVLSACTLIGYMLHKYKHPANTFAVILGEETEDEAKGGGTGKGILIKALEKMLNVETIDGKNFKPDKSFAYQRVKLDTKVIVIQDAEKTFDFKKFYSIITEGLTVEKKNQDELYISYADSPKVMVTTNYTISDDGNHAKRRQKVIEFSNYFGPERTPMQEYGHLLFEDWDNDEWNRFYNFMFWCVQVYLQNGIIEQAQGDRYKKKKIKTQYGEEFLEWFEEYASNGCADMKELSTVYQDFLNVNCFDKKDYTPRRFNFALKMAADNLGYDLDIRKNSQMNGKRFVKMVKRTA